MSLYILRDTSSEKTDGLARWGCPLGASWPGCLRNVPQAQPVRSRSVGIAVGIGYAKC